MAIQDYNPDCRTQQVQITHHLHHQYSPYLLATYVPDNRTNMFQICHI